MSDIVHSPETYNCACAACGGYNPDFYVDASLDTQAGGTANNKPIWTPEQIASYLNRTGGGFANPFRDNTTDGRQNNIGDDGSVITFGFFNTQAQVINNGYTYTANNAAGVPTLYGLSEVFQFGAFTEAQRAAAREAMQYWDDVLAVSFREASADVADMNFGNLTNSPNTQAYARIPTAGLDATLGGQVREIGGDSWYSISQASNFQLDEGGYGMNTLTHEIGHALGLSHPGNYNFGPGFSATYTNGAEYAQDARNYSIMSYWNPRDMGSTPTGVATRDFDWSLMSIAYGATPMVHDIAAMQKIYGADMTTRTGDTTYGFNSNAGRDAFDFTKTPWPTMAIWDAGGEDTLDASGFKVEQRIDLTPGSLSSIGGITVDEFPTFLQVNANRAAAGMPPVAQATYDANKAAFLSDPAWRGRLTDNVGIAYGATIENAKGGSGKDTIIGNAADNKLYGNEGNDVLFGNGGNDLLDGGLGNDEMSGGIGNDTYVVGETGDKVTEVAGEGTDTVRSSINYTLGDNLENLDLTGSAISGTGNSLDNRISGNELTNRLTGGAGNDVFVAEVGNDVATKRGDMSIDMIMDFGNGSDKIDLSGIDFNGSAAGNGTVNFVGKADGKNAGDVSFKSFGNINAAESVLGIDLDGIDGKGSNDPVSILFGHTDNDGIADFAIVLFGTNSVTLADLTPPQQPLI